MILSEVHRSQFTDFWTLSSKGHDKNLGLPKDHLPLRSIEANPMTTGQKMFEVFWAGGIISSLGGHSITYYQYIPDNRNNKTRRIS